MHCGIEKGTNRCIVGYILSLFNPTMGQICAIMLSWINLMALNPAAICLFWTKGISSSSSTHLKQLLIVKFINVSKNLFWFCDAAKHEGHAKGSHLSIFKGNSPHWKKDKGFKVTTLSWMTRIDVMVAVNIFKESTLKLKVFLHAPCKYCTFGTAHKDFA